MRTKALCFTWLVGSKEDPGPDSIAEQNAVHELPAD